MAIRKNAKGTQFTEALSYPHTELVPISVLKDMQGNKLRYDPSELIPSIQKEGLKSPGFIAYYQDSRHAVLDEGHHRLAALEKMGATHFPVTVHRVESDSKRGVPVRGIEPNMHGYVPGRLRPSEIMDIEEK